MKVPVFASVMCAPFDVMMRFIPLILCILSGRALKTLPVAITTSIPFEIAVSSVSLVLLESPSLVSVVPSRSSAISLVFLLFLRISSLTLSAINIPIFNPHKSFLMIYSTINFKDLQIV